MLQTLLIITLLCSVGAAGLGYMSMDKGGALEKKIDSISADIATLKTQGGVTGVTGANSRIVNGTLIVQNG